jgi:uncharacterized protein
MPPPDVVTAVIEHDTRVGAEADYGVWLQHITACAQRFPGHVGVNIIRPSAGSRRYTIEGLTGRPVSRRSSDQHHPAA